MLVAVQAKTPISDDVTLCMVNVLSVVVKLVIMSNDLDTIMYLLLLSYIFIITSLKYQLISGTGSPVAAQVKFTVSLLSSLISVISDIMTG